MGYLEVFGFSRGYFIFLGFGGVRGCLVFCFEKGSVFELGGSGLNGSLGVLLLYNFWLVFLFFGFFFFRSGVGTLVGLGRFR